MRHGASLLAVLLATSGGLWAQSPASQPPAPPPAAPVFRSGADLVRFDLSVVDGDGRPLTDVRPEEIQILEDGRVLPLVLFQRVQEPAGRYAEAAIRAVSAEVTSNEATPRGHLYIFIFDQQHITPGNEQAARRAAETFIRTRVRPSDRVAVYGVPGPGPDLPFTADAKRAIAEVAKVRGALERTAVTGLGRLTIQEAYDIAGGDQKAIDTVLHRLAADLAADVGGGAAATGDRDNALARFNGEEDYSTQVKLMRENARTIVRSDEAVTRDTLQRLSDLMTQFKTIDGRKTIVFFSEGFHDQGVSRELQNVAAAAAETYSVFFTMDLNRRLAYLYGATTTASSVDVEIQNRTSPLATLALETDGVFVTDAAAQLDATLGRIADRSQDYYVAGFVPAAGAAANRGEYRHVTVRVTRPGARVSARTGYALPRASAPPDRRRAIDAALAAPFVQQSLKVDYTTYVLRSEKSAQARVVLSLVSDLPVRAGSRDRADVVFLVRDVRDGRVVASGTDTIPLPDAAADEAPLGRGSYRVQFDVPPGSYLMRAVVREPGGLLGSADRRLDVPALNGPGIAASDLVLGAVNGGLPVRATAYTQDGLGGVLEVYGRSAEQLSAVSVRVSLAPEGGGETTGFDADVAAPDALPEGVRRRVTFTLPLAKVAPGPYVASVHVRAAGEEVATLTRQLEVRPGTAPVAPVPAPAPAPPAADPRDVARGDVFKRATTEWRTADPAAAAHAVTGFERFARGDFAGAAVELQQAFAANEKSAATAFVLGWAWEASGDSRKAIGAWRAAAVADPSLVAAHLALADAYLHLASRDLALQALRAGLAAVPDSVELKNKLAQIDAGR